MLCTATNHRLTDFRCDVGIIMVPEQPDLDAMNPTTAIHLRKLMNLGDFKGEAKTSSFIYTNDEKIPRLLFVGAGNPEDLERIRQIYAQSAKTVSEIGLTSATIGCPCEIVKSPDSSPYCYPQVFLWCMSGVALKSPPDISKSP